MSIKALNTSSKDVNFFNCLPKDLYMEIAKYLPMKDVWRWQVVDKFFSAIYKDVKIEEFTLSMRLRQLKLTIPSDKNKDVGFLRRLFQRALQHYLNPLFIAKEPKFNYGIIQWAAQEKHLKLLGYILSNTTTTIQCLDLPRPLKHLPIELSDNELNRLLSMSVTKKPAISSTLETIIQENSSLISRLSPPHLGDVLKQLVKGGKAKLVEILIKRTDDFAKVEPVDLRLAFDSAIEKTHISIVEMIVKSSRFNEIKIANRWNAFFFLKKHNNPLSDSLLSSFEDFGEKNFILTLYQALLNKQFARALELTNTFYFQTMDFATIRSLAAHAGLKLSLSMVSTEVSTENINDLTQNARTLLTQQLNKKIAENN